MSAARIIVTGRVQGVGYRWWTERQAKALGLAGWVRNRRDGSVEVFVEGTQRAITTFAEECAQGPPAAKVADVKVEEAAALGTERFTQHPTA